MAAAFEASAGPVGPAPADILQDRAGRTRAMAGAHRRVPGCNAGHHLLREGAGKGRCLRGGRLLKAAIVGIAGTTLTPDEAALLRAEPPCGVILFARNIQ